MGGYMGMSSLSIDCVIADVGTIIIDNVTGGI